MAISRVFFSDLKSGKCSSVVEARLLRFWEARNVKRGGELTWVDMLLMDVNVKRLAVGTMYSVSCFDVARCAQNFKLADSSLMIRFNDSTEFDVLSDPVSPIPAEGFRFRNQTELVGLDNTNTQLPDIIGEIVVVKSTVSDHPEDKNRFMVTVKLENDVSVTLSLFDAQAVSFHQKLGGMRGDPKVIVATSINPKMVGGRLFLNATSRTHVYYDKETHAGESLFYRLVASDTGLPSAAPLLKSYAKVEPVTIAELNNFSTTDPPQAEEGVNPEDFVMPPIVAGMEGKPYTFQVRVTPYNFTVNHQTFTVSRIINEVERAPAPDFVDDGGDDNDDDDAPNRTINREKSGSSKGSCESSKSAGKEPVGNVRKRAHIA
ncbi:unnamed protein product [Brassica rapa subsp. narinosa]